MEKPHQEYRDELADKLREIRNSDPENPEIAKAKAQGYLDAKKETSDYIKSQETHFDERIFKLKAENRLRKVMDYCVSNNLTTNSEEDILEGLRAVDLGYESGICLLGNQLHKLYSWIIDEIESGIRDKSSSYDLEKLDKFCKEFVQKLLMLPSNSFWGNFEDGTNVVLILSNDYGSHTLAEYKCSNSQYLDNKELRAQKFKNFIQQFKKSPERIEQEGRDEEVKKQQQINETELNKFDPSI